MNIQEPSLTMPLILDTDAGSIDFGFIAAAPEILGLYQSLEEVLPQENTFILENGSKWSSSYIDMIENWMETNRLLLTQNQAILSTHRFALVNPILQKAVPISLLREPIPQDFTAFYISRLDYANDVVYLNDRSEWTVYSHDHGTLRKYTEHDRVILGINTSDTLDIENKKRYLLINTATNQYVRANPIG